MMPNEFIENPAELRPDPESFPKYHSPWQIERDAGAEEYKAKLREMVLKIIAETKNTTMTEMYAYVGQALVRELTKNE